MVRPKLVEEGVPIGSTEETEGSQQEEGMTEASRPAHHNQHVSQPIATAPASPATRPSTQTQQRSSLLQAAGGKLPSKPRGKRHATRVVIGGEDQDVLMSAVVLGHDAEPPTVEQHVQAEENPSSFNHAHAHQQHHHWAPSSHHKPPHIHATHMEIGGDDAEMHAVEHPLQPPMQEEPAVMPPPPLPMPAGPTRDYSAQTPEQPVHHHAVHSKHGQRHGHEHHHHHHRTFFHAHKQHIEIGADDRRTERMEGVEDHSVKAPLVVMDGANVAYAYAQSGGDGGSSLRQAQRDPPEPDARGIRVACEYFRAAGVRVLVVLPQSWLRVKPRPGDLSGDAAMQTDRWEILQGLQRAGLLATSPPTDDDDAYVLTIARRESARAAARRGQGPGYVLSNDLFRDAQRRDGTGRLAHWLHEGDGEALGPGRISYTFCHMGRIDDHGERELDIVPNPRHPLVTWIERQHAAPAYSKHGSGSF